MAVESKPPAKPKRPAWLRWGIRLGIVVVLYTIVGFLVVPAIIKSQMLKRLPALTHRAAALEQVKFNPYALSLTLRGFSLKETNGDDFVSFGELYINFQLSSIFRGKWTFAEISLKDPFAQITYRADGTFNFADLLTNAPAAQPAGPPKPPPPVLVYRLSITNGAVGFTDLTRDTPLTRRIEPIQLDISGLTTGRDQKSPYTIIARTDSGEVFSWRGNVTVNPVRSAGTFELRGLRLPRYHPYSVDYSRFQIADGTLDVAADYRYDSSTNALDAEITNGVVQLNHLDLQMSDSSESVLKIPMLAVRQISASLANNTAHVGRIESSGGFELGRRNADGTLNLLSQLVPLHKRVRAAIAATLTNVPALPSRPWSARIDEIAFDNYTLHLEDRVPARPAALDIDKLGFTIKGISTASNTPIDVALSLRIQQTGGINVTGQVTALPPSANLQLAITNLDLRVAQPYVDGFVKLVIAGGTLDVNGKARYAGAAGAPMANFTGDVALNHFNTTDDVLFKEFTRWDRLAVTGINLDVQPNRVQVGEVRFTGLNGSVIIGPDKRMNLQTILRKETPAGTAATAASATTPAAATPAPMPPVELGSLVLEDTAIHFADQSIEPHCTFDVKEFGGSISGLSSALNTTANVDVKGKVDAGSPFTVSGRINPLSGDLFVDVAVAFTNTQLTAFSPYTEKYAGRPLEKGKLSFAVHYLINKKDLKSENGFFIDQLTLGAKNNSPDATSLPVKLAIALLKDRNGRIQLDVPVSGRIDDPKFRVGPIIWQVVVNLMVKAATSPFSLLGAMFGGGGEELSYVDFAPGQTGFVATETNKLDKLAKALYERPGLSLEITGSVDPPKDRDALAHVKLEDQIRALWHQEQMAASNAPAQMQAVELDAATRQRLVERLYENVFGHPPSGATNQTVVAPGTNAPPALPKAPAVAAVAGTAPEPRSQPAHLGAMLVHWHGPGTGTAAPAPNAVARVVARTGPAQPAAVTSVTPAVPAAAPTDSADLETQLLQKITVTDDDLRELMQSRSASVQSYLLQSQKVTGDRLFIIAPRPIGPSFTGQDRVNLTLE